MKNRVLRILVLGVIVASLTGCGTKTEATEQMPENNNAVEADGADETESISEGAGDTNTSVGAEDENIVLYAEKGDRNTDFYDLTYTTNPTVLTANTDIPVYCENGNEVGYIRNGATVTIEENANELACSRFKNPISGTEYDYLYIMNDYLIARNEVSVTTENLKEDVVDYIYSIEEDTPTVVNVPTSDMEVYEFRMSATYSNITAYDYDLWFYCNENGFKLTDYMTYAVETIEDDGDVVCRIYYKDAYED